MTLKVKNRWHYKGCYKGNDLWEWEAFLEDFGSGELSNVNHVEYILHPTFNSPVQKIYNPFRGFLIKNYSYGPFELKAFVYFKDGKILRLTHELGLYCNPTEGITYTIFSGNIMVRPRDHFTFLFYVPPQANLSLHFTAYGGRRDDIEVLIIDNTSFNNWVSKLVDVPKYYYEKKRTDNIIMSLPNGDYNLIYSNRFSIISTKTVTTNVKIIQNV